jgi:hypothetical protein
MLMTGFTLRFGDPLKMFKGFELDVRLVSYGPPTRAVHELAKTFG